MSMLLLIFASHLSFAQPMGGKAVEIDVSYLKLAAQTGTLSYDSANESRQEEIQLFNVQLTIGGVSFRPAIHLAAYLDEISGSAICKQFGFLKGGYLGRAMKPRDLNTFNMNAHDAIDTLELSDTTAEGHRVSSEVICDL